MTHSMLGCASFAFWGVLIIWLWTHPGDPGAH